MAQTVKHLPIVWETQVQSLGWEDLLEKEMATHFIFLPGKSHGWSLVGYSPLGHKESDTTEQLHFTSQILKRVPSENFRTVVQLVTLRINFPMESFKTKRALQIMTGFNPL